MLSNNYIFLMQMGVIMVSIGFMLNSKHLLMSLLYLEMFMLMLVILIPLTLSLSMTSSMFISIILLSIGACEASLGLALMVMMSRSYGSDMMNCLTKNKC